ncbi:MAG: hypothetical protein KF838_04370 [Phycisphaeraceae bacterium]|nr:MAG: hypothetical protein KF838_04370 [Phycisphaeraceae bacterium]
MSRSPAMGAPGLAGRGCPVPPPGPSWAEQIRPAREALDRTLEDGGDEIKPVKAAVEATFQPSAVTRPRLAV